MTVSPARWPYLDNLRTLLVAGISDVGSLLVRRTRLDQHL